jgi:hypothetical protein
LGHPVRIRLVVKKYLHRNSRKVFFFFASSGDYSHSTSLGFWAHELVIFVTFRTFFITMVTAKTMKSLYSVIPGMDLPLDVGGRVSFAFLNKMTRVSVPSVQLQHCFITIHLLSLLSPRRRIKCSRCVRSNVKQ